MNPSARPLAALVALFATFGAMSCGNPAVDPRIDALGDEKAGVEPSEFHRPGQPCLLCHGKYEGASPEMSVAGTVYGTPSSEIPVEDVRVTLVDAQGETRTVKSNCIGNFFITRDQWDPLFPLHAEIEYAVPGAPETTKRVVMSTRINRDGSCAGCHVGKPNQGSPGWVYCAAADSGFEFPEPASSCPGAR